MEGEKISDMVTNNKEDVAKQLTEVADKMKDIANDIANDRYDPRKWVEVSSQFNPLFACLKTFPQEFMKALRNNKESMEVEKI